jgi:hypothetical protein
MIVTCNLMGGLGNQLFQIFALISHSLDTQNQCVFMNVDNVGIGTMTIRPTYWKTFLQSLHEFTKHPTNIKINVIIQEEGADQYTNLKQLVASSLPSQLDNIMFYGYFQSYKYFQTNYHIITQLIRLKEQQADARQYMPTTTTSSVIVSMHFRFGDYKRIPGNVLPYSYFKNSILHMHKKLADTSSNARMHILYFCEPAAVEDVAPYVEQLKTEFSNVAAFELADPALPDYVQMMMMSLCSHHIVANSTFSWWGAYFNESPNKIVCYPKTWTQCPKDFIPVGWTSLPVE